MTIRDGRIQSLSQVSTLSGHSADIVQQSTILGQIPCTPQAGAIGSTSGSNRAQAENDFRIRPEAPVQRRLFASPNPATVQTPTPLGRDRGRPLPARQEGSSINQVQTASRSTARSNSQVSAIALSRQMATRTEQSPKRARAEIEHSNEEQRKLLESIRDQIRLKRARKEGNELAEDINAAMEELRSLD